MGPRVRATGGAVNRTAPDDGLAIRMGWPGRDPRHERDGGRRARPGAYACNTTFSQWSSFWLKIRYPSGA